MTSTPIVSFTVKPKPKASLVIPALKDRDWRAVAKKRKAAQICVPEPVVREAEVEIKPQVEESEDQLALRALLANANGEVDEDFPNGKAIIPVTEDEAFQQDVKELPESSTLDDYSNMPVSEFGAAMLRGMGWTGEGKDKKNIQPWLPQSRPSLLGIGAKEKEIFDDGSKKKLFGKPDKKYIPVIKKERQANSSASSRNRTPSPSRRSGPRRRTRSPSPGRKDRTPRGGDRRGNGDDERKQGRDRGDERRRERDRDTRKHRDDDRDGWKEQDEDRRRDRNRGGHRHDRDSDKRNRSRDRHERRGDKRD